MPIYNARLEQININEMRRYAGLQKVSFSEERLEAARSEALLYIEPKTSWELYDYDCKSQIIKSNPPVHIKGEKHCRVYRNCPVSAQLCAWLAVELRLLER